MKNARLTPGENEVGPLFAGYLWSGQLPWKCSSCLPFYCVSPLLERKQPKSQQGSSVAFEAGHASCWICRRNCVMWAPFCWELDKDKGRSCFWIYKIIPLAVPTDGAALANQASCPLLRFSLNGAINSRNKVHGLLSLYYYLCCNKCRGGQLQISTRHCANAEEKDHSWTKEL